MSVIAMLILSLVFGPVIAENDCYFLDTGPATGYVLVSQHTSDGLCRL